LINLREVNSCSESNGTPAGKTKVLQDSYGEEEELREKFLGFNLNIKKRHNRQTGQR